MVASPSVDSIQFRTMATVDKSARYEHLVSERKDCQRCNRYLENPSRVQGGKFDSCQIGPYSQWHDDLDAELVVVAKDFAPAAKFIEYRGVPGKAVQTNLRLSKHLEGIGFHAGTADQSFSESRLFFTNAILCLPPGDDMRTPTFLKAAGTCGRVFLRPLVDLVSPRAIISLGEQATEAVLQAYGDSGRFQNLMGLDDGHSLSAGPKLFAVPHPVASFKKEVHLRSWERVEKFLSASGPQGKLDPAARNL